MKLLAMVIHSKKGEPLLIATSSCLSTHNAILYCHSIYEHILQTYRSRSKIERTLGIQNNLLCVCNISKEYICYVFVRKDDLSLAFDGIRKITQYFSNNKTTSNRIENLSKKPIQFMSIMEQFLYTREVVLLKDQYLSFNTPTTSKKKGVDFQIFNKFGHIVNDTDRRWMLEGQMISNRVEGKEIQKQIKAHEVSQKFSKRNQEDMLQNLLQVDPQKQNYIKIYRKAIMRLGVGVGGRSKPNPLHSIKSISPPNSTTQYNSQVNELSLISDDYQSLIYQPSFITDQNHNQQQKLKMIKVKFLQKLQLHMHNTKVKQVIQYGQLLLEITPSNSGISFDLFIKLVSQKWLNPKIINRRISPNSIPVQSINQSLFKIKSSAFNQKSKPIIDYVIRKQTFTSQKIPLLFMYTMEVSSHNIQFIFKYKLNEKNNKKLFDIEIAVYLNQQFIPMDCKTVPAAHSLKNNKVTWKTKEISNQSTSNSQSKAKGRILMAFGSSNIPPTKIIKEIRLTMKSYSELIEGLNVQIQVQKNDQIPSNFREPKEIQRLMTIEYKVFPNDVINH